jgi:magnesium transporter
MLPNIFRYFRFDPALASGPFATVLCDSTSLLIYFSIAKAFL